MTEIYLHIVARMADYMAAHPYAQTYGSLQSKVPTDEQVNHLYANVRRGGTTVACFGVAERSRKRPAKVIDVEGDGLERFQGANRAWQRALRCYHTGHIIRRSIQMC